MDCANCGKSFEPRNSAQIACSQDCYRALWRAKRGMKPQFQVSKKCPQCGKEFSVPHSHAARRTCCSKECYTLMKRGRKMPVTARACLACGKEFEGKPQAKYCSVKCRDNQVEKVCQHCGKPFLAKQSHAHRIKYCSRECFGAARSAPAMETRQCIQCGEAFTVYKRLLQKYCSPACTQIANKGKPRIQGGVYVTSQGYRVLNRGKESILEHRHVMQEKLGRPLHQWENVHHRDGNRLNNSLDNLEVWVVPQPPGQRPEDLIPWMIDYLTVAGYTVQKNPTLPLRGELNAGS